MSDFIYEVGEKVRYTPDGIIASEGHTVLVVGKYSSGRNWYRISGKNKPCHESNIWPTRKKILGLI